MILYIKIINYKVCITFSKKKLRKIRIHILCIQIRDQCIIICLIFLLKFVQLTSRANNHFMESVQHAHRLQLYVYWLAHVLTLCISIKATPPRLSSINWNVDSNETQNSKCRPKSFFSCSWWLPWLSLKVSWTWIKILFS